MLNICQNSLQTRSVEGYLLSSFWLDMHNTLFSSVYIFSWVRESERGAWNGHTRSATNNESGEHWPKAVKHELTRNVMSGVRGERDLCQKKWSKLIKVYKKRKTKTVMKMKFKGATLRGFCGVLAQTILEISGSQLIPLITFSLNI